MDTSPPTSQQPDARPLAFLLDDAVSGLGPVDPITLYVRPEDLTRQDPSRLAVTQTLNGGAWADSFGPGVPSISISGTTGWRRAPGLTEDGEGRFLKLRSTVFDSWHERRKQAIAASRDPSDVKLIFSDGLDNYVATVAPVLFVLRRSRSRPLLLQYQIQMMVLADGVGNLSGPSLGGALGSDVLASLGLSSLSASLATITAFANNARNFIDRTLLAPVTAFMATTQRVYSAVSSAIGSVTGVASSLVAVARTTAQAGANVFRTIALIANTPQIVQAELLRVAAAYTNIFCVMRNAIGSGDTYLDYSTIYGSSNCSSTAGGSAISSFLGANTMQSIVPAPVAPIVSISTAAQAAMSSLTQSDVVLAPLPTTTLASLAAAVGSGVVLA